MKLSVSLVILKSMLGLGGFLLGFWGPFFFSTVARGHSRVNIPSVPCGLESFLGG